MKPKKRRRLYDRIVAQLPGTVDDFVTPEKHFRGRDLRRLTSAPGQLFHGDTAVEFSQAVAQECHAVSAYAWLCNPGWRYVYGFAALDSCCENEWHCHSFCLDEAGTVIEPTPLGREQYWGVVLDAETTKAVVAEELDNIRRLGFEVTEAHLARLR